MVHSRAEGHPKIPMDKDQSYMFVSYVWKLSETLETFTSNTNWILNRLFNSICKNIAQSIVKCVILTFR